ncbi:hypothetical protein ACSSUR_13740 [Pseudomonas cedrina]|uniref:hypothetical protein n=1 Tax=Pseudomonas cedrina TaxID=651740 RepID=UPI003ED92E53
MTDPKPTNTSGPFPKLAALKAPATRRCTPAVAGILAGFYTSQKKNLAVLETLELEEVKDQARIDRLKANNEDLRKIAHSYASGVSLPDWKRRLSADTKRAFSFLGLATTSDAKAFTFRLGHETADAALAAAKGSTDYLSTLIRKIGITHLAFVTEFTDSKSVENHPFHIHGVARIPDGFSIQSIEELLAPKQDLKSAHPMKGYRKRGKNEAVSVTELQTPGAWVSYTGKEIDFTAHRLQSGPDYASRSATLAGRELYEAMRTWLRS